MRRLYGDDVHEYVLPMQLNTISMDRKTRVITLSALFSALSVIFLYIASVWPTGRFGLVALSSLFVAAAVCDAGILPSVYVFIVSSALGMLLLPDKSAPLLYILFFGYYPVLKSLIERLEKVVIQWVLKLIVFNIALIIILFFLRTLILGNSLNYPTPVLYAGGNIIFIVFDYGFSKVMRFYNERVSKRMKGKW